MRTVSNKGMYFVDKYQTYFGILYILIILTFRNVLSVPRITSELKDIRCCDGDAVTLECKVFAPSEPPNIRWEKSGKVCRMSCRL